MGIPAHGSRSASEPLARLVAGLPGNGLEEGCQQGYVGADGEIRAEDDGARRRGDGMVERGGGVARGD